MTDMVFTKSIISSDKANFQQARSDNETTGIADLFPAMMDILGLGLVIFGRDMTIQYSTPIAARWLKLTDRIDQSLQIADSKVDWKMLLDQSLSGQQPAKLGQIRISSAGSSRILSLSYLPVFFGNERSCRGAITMEDITEKISRENELSQAERLIAIGKVAGKVAHELNNPMDGILRYLNLALRILEQGDVEKTKEYLSQSRMGLLRMVHILRELLEFSRSSSQAMEPAPLDVIIQDALSATASALSGIHVQIIRRYEGQALMMRNDSLFQVFCNLIKNACDVMQGKGQLTITIETASDHWRISFLDTGPGILPELREAIFQPFFTTKTNGKGVGLGLAICKDLVEKHKGTITVHCPDEGGSLFTICLPASTGTTGLAKQDKVQQ